MTTVSILGAGAMGCLWAVHLHHAFQKMPDLAVQFLSTRTNAPRQLGISLNSPFLSTTQHQFNIELPVCSPADLSIATKEQPRLILLCTKSYHALTAVQDLQAILNEHCYLVLFQNGLGSQHQILEALPNLPIYAAVSTEGVNRQSGGQLIHAGKGLTRIGPLNEAAKLNTRFEQCLRILNQPGIAVQPEDNIWPALWEKLAINCAINPFTAILNCPNGEIINTPMFQENWPELKQELSAMLEMAGMPLNPEKLESRVFQVIENTRHNISSMLQDVRAGRKTEIEDINGFAARFLNEHGLQYKINAELSRQVLDQEVH